MAIEVNPNFKPYNFFMLIMNLIICHQLKTNFESSISFYIIYFNQIFQKESHYFLCILRSH